MTDKELLELAAKAAGLHGLMYFDSVSAGGKGMRSDELSWNNWNPLKDDGDAFRLAVKLNLIVETGKCWISKLGPMFGEDVLPDPCTATRRAIVRAAAEIGKMKGIAG